jgi:hypothetical protein
MEEKLKGIQKLLPKRAEIKLGRKGGTRFIEIFVDNPSFSEEQEEKINNKISDIIGRDNIMEIYTEETGRHWFVYLKK